MSFIRIALATIIYGVAAFSAGAEDFDFKGKSICMIEEARGMWMEGLAGGFRVETPATSFELTMGPVAEKDLFAVHISRAENNLIDGWYEASNQPNLYHRNDAVGFLWLNPKLGKIEVISRTVMEPDARHAYAVYTAKCFRSE